MAEPRRPEAAGVAALLLMGMGVAVLFPTLDVGYVSDDYPHIAALEAGASPFDPMPAGTGTYVRPLLMASMAAERALWPGDAAPLHHAVNLAIHLAAALLLWALVRRLRPREPADRPAADPGALFALGVAGLFLLHPVQVDDVAWIAGRQDSLVGLALLAGVLGVAAWSRGGPKAWLALPVAGLPVALLAKESGVVYAPSLVLAWAAMARAAPVDPGRGRPLAWLLAGLLAATAAWMAWVAARFYDASRLPASGGLREAAEVLLTFPALLVAPHRQTFLIEVYRAHPWILPVGLVVVLAAAMVLALTARRAGSLGLLALLAGLVLLQLAPYVVAGGLNGRRAYVPLAALAIALALAGRRWPALARRAAPALVVLAALAAVPSAAHAGSWGRAGRLADRWCESFRRVATWPPDAPYALAAWPYALGEVPVWSNDAAAALHHCRTGRFAMRDDVVLGAPLYSRGPLPDRPVVSAVRPAADRIRLEVRGSAFRVRPIRSPDAADPDLERSGDIIAVTVEAPDSLPAVWFDGTAFQRLAGTPSPDGGYGP